MTVPRVQLKYQKRKRKMYLALFQYICNTTQANAANVCARLFFFYKNNKEI